MGTATNETQGYGAGSGLVVNGSNLDNTLITGAAGGQTVTGGTASGDNLDLRSTSNATKGFTRVGGSTGMVYDETNKRIGVNQSAPDCVFHAGSTLNAAVLLGAGSMPSVICLQGGAGTFPGMMFGASSAARGRLTCDDSTGVQLSTNVGTLSLFAPSNSEINLTNTQAQIKPGGTLVLHATTAGVFGSSSASGNLNLGSTSNATKGLINFGANGSFDETNRTFQINDTLPIFQSNTNSTTGNGKFLASATGGATLAMQCYGSAGTLSVFGTSRTGPCVLLANSFEHLYIGNTHANGELVLGSNNLERLRLDAAGNVTVGTAAVATNATDGFLYIPTCAGTPTGAPTTKTGRAAQVYDTTNNKLYVYNGAWKGVTLA